MQVRDLERNIDSVRASVQPDFKQAQWHVLGARRGRYGGCNRRCDFPRPTPYDQI